MVKKIAQGTLLVLLAASMAGVLVFSLACEVDPGDEDGGPSAAWGLEVDPQSVTRLVSGPDEARRFQVQVKVSGEGVESGSAFSVNLMTYPMGVIADGWAETFGPESADNPELEFDYPFIKDALDGAGGGDENTYVVEYECVEVGTTSIEITVSSSSNSSMSPTSAQETVEVTCAADDEPTDQCDDDEDGETAEALAVALKLGMTKEQFCNSALLRVVIDQIIHSSYAVDPKPTNDDHTETQAIAPATLSADLSEFPCGEGPNGYTICSSTAGDFPSGETTCVFNIVVNDVPLDDDTNLYQYGFVFDQDGDTGNNYEASSSYPNDFFDGTDFWYVAGYTPTGGWSLAATDATGGSTSTLLTDARIIIAGNVLILAVPTSEMAEAFPMLRVTNFRHTGDWGMNPPYDWDGCVYPAVADGLYDWE